MVHHHRREKGLAVESSNPAGLYQNLYLPVPREPGMLTVSCVQSILKAKTCTRERNLSYASNSSSVS